MKAVYLYYILLFIIGIVLPLLAITTGNRTRQFLIEFPDKKTMVYKQTIVLQLLLMTIVFGSMIINGDSVSIIGISFIFQTKWIVLLILICVFVWMLIIEIEIDSSKIEGLTARYQNVLYLLPSTDKEYKWSIALSIVVGFCEEIIFRGFLFWQINQFISLLPAVLLTNLIFALGHFATQAKNMIATFIIGIIWSVIFIMTDSLWFPVLTHILIDVYSTTMAFKLANKSKI